MEGHAPCPPACRAGPISPLEPVLSTMWLQKRFDHLNDFFAAGRAMGFRQFEPGAVVTPSMLEGVVPGQQLIPSVHAPCPNIRHVSGQSAAGLFASTDEAERTWAVSRIKATIDLALHLGARAVILHAGRVDVSRTLEKRLRDLHPGNKNPSKYEQAKEQLVAARARKQPANLAAARRSLEEVVPYARAAGIKLGLEVRYYYCEIPNLEEMRILLADFPDAVYYWHDTGHAQNLENLGFTPQEEWLRDFGPRTLGVHLHDIRGLKDHLIPGMGEIDFGMVASYLPDGAIRTCEFDYPFSEEEMTTGVEFLRKMDCLG
jgi:sugar phosphate isomerase/epimerase